MKTNEHTQVARMTEEKGRSWALIIGVGVVLAVVFGIALVVIGVPLFMFFAGFLSFALS